MQLPTEKEIREVGILIAKNILQTCKVIAQGKLKVLLEVNRPEWKDPNNRTRGIDQFAHTLAVTELYSKFGNGIEVYGEEEKKKPRTLAKVRKLVAFVDAIDGTDLLARGFANWVCAMVFFNPKENKIIVSGVNVLKVHKRARKSGEKGQIIDKTMPIHVSNVKLADAKAKAEKKPKAVKAK